MLINRFEIWIHFAEENIPLLACQLRHDTMRGIRRLIMECSNFYKYRRYVCVSIFPVIKVIKIALLTVVSIARARQSTNTLNSKKHRTKISRDVYFCPSCITGCEILELTSLVIIVVRSSRSWRGADLALTFMHSPNCVIYLLTNCKLKKNIIKIKTKIKLNNFCLKVNINFAIL